MSEQTNSSNGVTVTRPKPKRPGLHNFPSCGWDSTHVRGDVPFRSDAQPIAYRGAWFCDDVCKLCYVDNGHKPLSAEQRAKKEIDVANAEQQATAQRRAVAERERREQELKKQLTELS